MSDWALILCGTVDALDHSDFKILHTFSKVMVGGKLRLESLMKMASS